MAGRMLKHIEEPETLIEDVKSIQHFYKEVTKYDSMGPVGFVEEILVNGYQNMICQYTKDKYFRNDTFKNKGVKYMR